MRKTQCWKRSRRPRCCLFFFHWNRSLLLTDLFLTAWKPLWRSLWSSQALSSALMWFKTITRSISVPKLTTKWAELLSRELVFKSLPQCTLTPLEVALKIKSGFRFSEFTLTLECVSAPPKTILLLVSAKTSIDLMEISSALSPSPWPRSVFPRATFSTQLPRNSTSINQKQENWGLPTSLNVITPLSTRCSTSISTSPRHSKTPSPLVNLSTATHLTKWSKRSARSKTSPCWPAFSLTLWSPNCLW